MERSISSIVWYFFTVVATCSCEKEEFKFRDKYALVTGGAQGIGFGIISQLLENGGKGVTLLDIDAVKGERAVENLNSKFGKGRVLFLSTDSGDLEQFAGAFNTSMSHWGWLDIVVNNAGVNDENNWKGVVNVNALGSLHGTLLAFQYMSKSKGGRGGIIINISSTAGVEPFFFTPVYTATKHFVVGLGRSLGHETYLEHDCSEFALGRPISNALNPNLKQMAVEASNSLVPQSPNNVAKGVVSVIEKGSSGSVWIVEDDQAPYEIGSLDAKSMQKKIIEQLRNTPKDTNHSPLSF